MTAKQFFKSNAFKSLIVLIAIVLVAGALLAIFNDLLYISDEERLNRTLSKIYGKTVSAQAVELTEEEKTYSYGTVDNVYYIEDDGNYLFKTTGIGGYPGNGTVTLWTVVTCTGTREENNLVLTGIEKVVYDSNQGQTLISNLNDSFYAFFAEHDDLVAEGGYFTSVKGGTDDLNNVIVQTTMSSKAASNAVNTALACFRKVMVGETEPAPGDPVHEFYGEAVSYETLTVAEAGKTNEYGTIDAAYYIAEKSQYLFKTTGIGGFSSGTVTLWTAVNAGKAADDTITLTGIEKVVYESNVDQSWMDNVIADSDFFNNFANKDDLVAAGGYFTANPNGSGDLNNVVAGTSLASNASCNAVNAALYYFRTTLAGEEAPAPTDPVHEFYGEEVDYDVITVADADKTNEYGTLDAVYYVAEKGQYLFKTTGIGGFKNGTVTLWTALTVEKSENGETILTGIDKVVYESNVDQSWMDKIPQSFFDNFATKDDLISEGGYFFANKDSSDDLNNVTVGVSKASTASCNAVNTALYYFRNVIEIANDPASKFYGHKVTSEKIILTDDETSTEYGTVDEVYYIVDDGNYLFKTTGIGGFKNGTVTLWTLVTCTGAVGTDDFKLTGIEKVVYESNVDQSWMDRIPQSFFDNFAAKDDLIAEGGYFFANKDYSDDLNNVTVGVSKASTASCNAVNAALYCFRNVILTTNDAASKVYGYKVSSEKIELTETETSTEYGTVDEVYYIVNDGNYLFKTTGIGGFKDGTVTLWTLVSCTGSLDDGTLQITGIEKVVFDSHVSQSWMGKIPQSFFDNFATKDDLVAAGGYFFADKNSSDDLNNVTIGVSLASNASCNAVNAALWYFRNVFMGGDA